MKAVFFVVLAIVILAALVWLSRPESPRDGDDRTRQPQLGIEEPRPVAEPSSRELPPLHIDATPDHPQPFGFKMGWLAIKSDDPSKIIAILELKDVRPANWSTGTDSAYRHDGHAFISPPISGWVFVVCSSFPEIGQASHSGQWDGFMRSLAKQFDEVQYFATHRVVDFHAWSKWTNGKEVRSYAYIGESGETLANFGNKTPGEIELKLNFFDETSPEAKTEAYWERADLRWPNEVTVMQIAGKWSIDPQTMGDLDLPASSGWIGRYDRRPNR